MRSLVGALGSVLLALYLGACGGAEDSTSVAAPKAKTSVAVAPNRKPVVRDLQLSPMSPVPGDRVVASVDASDPDGDSVEVIYQWRANGRLLDANDPFLDVENLTKGALIEATAFARDGKEQSAPLRSSARVGNTVPILQGVILEPLGEITANNDVVAHPDAVDPDDDTISFEFVWRVNGATVGEDSPILSAQHFARGDQIELSVIASDADGSSPALRSAPIQVVNAPPRIVSVPGAFDADGVFRYALKIEDPDGDRMFRYQLEEAPKGMTVNPVDGELTWEPREDQAGIHLVRVTIGDRAGGITSQRFDVQVEFEPPIPASAAR